MKLNFVWPNHLKTLHIISLTLGSDPPVSLAEICGGLSVDGRGVGWNNDVQYLKEKENPTCKCTNQPNKYITSMVLSTVQIISSVE